MKNKINIPTFNTLQELIQWTADTLINSNIQITKKIENHLLSYFGNELQMVYGTSRTDNRPESDIIDFDLELKTSSMFSDEIHMCSFFCMKNIKDDNIKNLYKKIRNSYKNKKRYSKVRNEHYEEVFNQFKNKCGKILVYRTEQTSSETIRINEIWFFSNLNKNDFFKLLDNEDVFLDTNSFRICIAFDKLSEIFDGHELIKPSESKFYNRKEYILDNGTLYTHNISPCYITDSSLLEDSLVGKIKHMVEVYNKTRNFQISSIDFPEIKPYLKMTTEVFKTICKDVQTFESRINIYRPKTQSTLNRWTNDCIESYSCDLMLGTTSMKSIISIDANDVLDFTSIKAFLMDGQHRTILIHSILNNVFVKDGCPKGLCINSLMKHLQNKIEDVFDVEMKSKINRFLFLLKSLKIKKQKFLEYKHIQNTEFDFVERSIMVEIWVGDKNSIFDNMKKLNNPESPWTFWITGRTSAIHFNEKLSEGFFDNVEYLKIFKQSSVHNYVYKSPKKHFMSDILPSKNDGEDDEWFKILYIVLGQTQKKYNFINFDANMINMGMSKKNDTNAIKLVEETSLSILNNINNEDRLRCVKNLNSILSYSIDTDGKRVIKNINEIILSYTKEILVEHDDLQKKILQQFNVNLSFTQIKYSSVYLFLVSKLIKYCLSNGIELDGNLNELYFQSLIKSVKCTYNNDAIRESLNGSRSRTGREKIIEHWTNLSIKMFVESIKKNKNQLLKIS